VITESHAGIFQFAQRAQTLALVFLEPDPVRRLPGVWDVLAEAPRCDRDDDRAVLAEILRRLAGAFVRAARPRELPPETRLRRAKLSDVHCSRALECILREFADAALNLGAAARRCGVSAPYLSHLISVSTRHGFHTHLSGVRILHAAHLLATAPLSIQEVADKSGFGNTSALDREFKKRFNMTPGEFMRWA
jgi:AraC-like DNA-binding protein